MHSSEVAYIPISHCVTGVACWAPSTALQMMVCLPGWHSTPFSPCHSLQGSNPSLTRGTDQTHWEKGNLSRPEVGKGVNAGNAVWAARAGRGGGEGGGDNEFFTVIKTERETLSVMMDQKYEDVKRSCKKNPQSQAFLNGGHWEDKRSVRKHVLLWRWPSTGTVVQRGCGVSILGGAQKPSGHRPGLAVPGGAA